MGFDYNEYDSLSVLIKKKESDAILGYYKSFGWEEYERREDKRYFDIIHIKLKREHKVANKDKLQLLQVELENSLNRFAVLRNKKHWRFFAFFSLALLLAFFVIALGVSLLVAKQFLTLGVSFIALGASSFIFSIPIARKIFNYENRAYVLKFKETTSSVARIIFQAERLRGKNDEI